MKTENIIIPKFGAIITERPKGMNYDQYKTELKEQKIKLNQRLKGVMAYVVKEIITTEISGEKFESIRKYPTATKRMIKNVVIG